MPSGLQIINMANTVLIDETYTNLAIRQSGTLTMASGANSSATVAAPSYDSPLIATSSTKYNFVKRFSTNGVTPTIYIQGRAGPPSAAVNYYMFDKPLSSLATGNCGLQVFDASGNMTFDSRLKYARVVDVFGGTTRADWEGVRTYPAGRSYAVVQLKNAYSITSNNLGGGLFEVTWEYSMSKVEGNVVTTVLTEMMTKDASKSRTSVDLEARFAVIDVTGY